MLGIFFKTKCSETIVIHFCDIVTDFYEIISAKYTLQEYRHNNLFLFESIYMGVLFKGFIVVIYKYIFLELGNIALNWDFGKYEYLFFNSCKQMKNF